MIVEYGEARKALAKGISAIIDLPAPAGPLMLFLPPNAIEFFGDYLDRQWPGVHLYETPPVGSAPKFVRILGEAPPP